MTCDTCMYWVRQKKGFLASDAQGQCRRYPPVSQGIGVFPITESSEWCGEWSAILQPLTDVGFGAD
jgi:hypothetical protein